MRTTFTDHGAVWKVPQPVQLTPTTSGYLDAIRALAALAVVLSHWRGFYFVDYGQIQSGLDTWTVKAVYAATGFGHQSVMVFFVLSGFFISSSVLRNIGRHTWSWRDYAVDRSVRLYLVLLPGLFLGTIWDSIGIKFFNSSGIYSASLHPFGTSVPIANLTPITFIGNLLFLQTRFTPVLGSNGPLWSLFNEFWYYLLFPALVSMVLCIRRRAMLKTCGYLFLAAFAVWILGSAVSGFVVWSAGCAVALASRSLRFADNSNLLSALYIFCCGSAFVLCLIATKHNSWLGSDLAVGMSFAFLLHGIVQLHLPIGAFGLKLAKTFAGFSYTLYVVHFPLLFFIRANWLPNFRWQPEPKYLLYGLWIVACVILYAFGVALLTESNTANVREWVRVTLVGDTVRRQSGIPDGLPRASETTLH
jgi:peptidoglycan/LPS O-acetylase OafA/YrhL